MITFRVWGCRWIIGLFRNVRYFGRDNRRGRRDRYSVLLSKIVNGNNKWVGVGFDRVVVSIIIEGCYSIKRTIIIKAQVLHLVRNKLAEILVY